jgi:hypothetical protein
LIATTITTFNAHKVKTESIMDFGGAAGGGGMDLMSWYVRNNQLLCTLI